MCKSSRYILQLLYCCEEDAKGSLYLTRAYDIQKPWTPGVSFSELQTVKRQAAQNLSGASNTSCSVAYFHEGVVCRFSLTFLPKKTRNLPASALVAAFVTGREFVKSRRAVLRWSISFTCPHVRTR